MSGRIALVDLAKELDVRASDLMYLANDAGVEVTKMAAKLTESEARLVRSFARDMYVDRSSGSRIVRPKDRAAPRMHHISADVREDEYIRPGLGLSGVQDDGGFGDDD